jgi:NADH-quinone oxidoreductase subunit J
MTVGNVFFALFTLVCLFGSIVTISSRSPIRCAVGLLVTIIGISALFLQLSAEFLTAIQLIVYAGAVVVLFVFVIMLLGPDAGHHDTGGEKARLSRFLAGGLFAVMALAAAHFVSRSGIEPVRFGRITAEHGSVEAVGQLLFTKGIVPFELATALLIVAVVGAIAVARGRQFPRRDKATTNPTRRMFHGPLHPRDAGRPLPKGQEL